MLFFYCSLILLVLYYFSMSSYGRNRNSASSYQFRARPGYASGSFAPKGARKYTRKPAASRKFSYSGGRTFTPKFAMSGYARDVEKKYLDRALLSLAVSNVTSNTISADTTDGRMYRSTAWNTYTFNTVISEATNVTNNLVRAMGQGTTADTRIGNKINVKFVKGAITFTAAQLNSTPTAGANMYGESVGSSVTPTTVRQYFRTTIRWVLVKDLQVNSADPQVNWNDVFESGTKVGDTTDGSVSGVHAELNIANMGRFRVLSDKIFQLDATDPQKTVPFLVPGSQIGTVRYNGPTQTSYSDKGIYLIWAAYTNGIGQEAVNLVTAPNCTMHSRLCYTDS